MMYFWIATIALTLAACVLIAYPLLSNKANNDEALRDELNKAFYKDRLEELKEETSAGLVENQDDLVSDLKQSLLDDIPGDKAQKQSSLSPMAIFVPSVIMTVLLSYALYFKFGASDEVVRWHSVSGELPELSKKLMTGEELSDEELENITLALRTQLHRNPNDASGWLLLGRLGLADRNMNTAIDAMAKAYKLEPENEDVQLGYAQALMLSNDELDQVTARSLLAELVQQEYVDLRVFSLLAFDAFERQNFAEAIRFWSIMQQMIGPEDQRYEMLNRSIENAAKQMGDVVAPGKSVQVSIDLAPEVQASPDAVLIVSIHPADGSPMPIAAARYLLGVFPRTVVLDDGNAMMEGQKISAMDKLMVRVRIDEDGNVATRDNDWFGESEVVEFGQPVSVTIDSQY